jgi:hypothetical protein
MKENHTETYDNIVMQVTERAGVEMTPEYEKIAKKLVLDQIKKEFFNKIKTRFPNGLIPGAAHELPALDPKDRENTVYRVVAYKTQVDDCIKAFRKQGYAAREFRYNHELWVEEKKQRLIL